MGLFFFKLYSYWETPRSNKKNFTEGKTTLYGSSSVNVLVKLGHRKMVYKLKIRRYLSSRYRLPNAD